MGFYPWTLSGIASSLRPLILFDPAMGVSMALGRKDASGDGGREGWTAGPSYP